MTFDDLRKMPDGDMSAVNVKSIKDLYWRDGHSKHLCCTAGTTGQIVGKTGAGFIVLFDNGENRQVFDFDGETEKYRAEDQIELV